MIHTLPQVFGKIFSDDQAVITLVSKVMPLVASFQVSAKPNTAYMFAFV